MDTFYTVLAPYHRLSHGITMLGRIAARRTPVFMIVISCISANSCGIIKRKPTTAVFSTNIDFGMVMGNFTLNPFLPLELTAFNGSRVRIQLTAKEVTLSSVSTSSATWTTNGPADSQVWYAGISRQYPALVTGHRSISRAETDDSISSSDFSFATATPAGAIYYVDAVDGNDANVGTSLARPWKTIDRVNASSFNPGDRILFKSGQAWRGQLSVSSSGAPDNPIVFDSYGSGPKPIINAADLITDWVNVSADIWSAPMHWRPNQIFRRQARMVQEPSKISLTADNQWFYDGATTLFVFSVANPNTASIEASHRDYAFRLKDQDHVALNNMVLQYCNSRAGCYSALATSNRSGFSITNVDVLYSYGPGVSFDNTNGSLSSIVITDLTTDHCAFSPGGVGSVSFGTVGTDAQFTGVTVTGGHFAYAGVHGDSSVVARESSGIDLDNVKNSRFIGGSYDHNGSSAMIIHDGSSKIIVSGGTMHDDGQAPAGDGNEVGIGGIGAGSSDITLTGIDLYGSRSSIIEIATTNTNAVMTGITITNCKIHGGRSHGFQIGGGHRAIVFKYNLVYGNAGYGFFTNEGVTGDPAVLVYNNVFWGNGMGEFDKYGLYINSSGINLENNIIAESKGQEIFKSSGKSVKSDYNLWYHSAGGTFMTWDNTCYDLSGWKLQSGQDSNSLYANPLFLDALNSDFRIAPSSQAINAGTDLGSAYKDALDPRSATFPYQTIDQTSLGSGRVIGAFAFIWPLNEHP